MKTKTIEQPDLETLKKYSLVYYNSQPMFPAYCGYSSVFTESFEENEPIYAVYNGGTGRLVILEKRSSDWREIELSEVKNLKGLLWRIICTFRV